MFYLSGLNKDGFEIKQAHYLVLIETIRKK
jgi:hypothetical protein